MRPSHGSDASGWPGRTQFEAVQDKAADLAELVQRLWEDLSRPCPEATIRYALGCARRRSRALEPHRCVVVHGDAAAANALKVLQPRPGAETGFVFVDPDSFLGDPTYDLGVALRDWTLQLLVAGDPAVVEAARNERVVGSISTGGSTIAQVRRPVPSGASL